MINPPRNSLIHNEQAKGSYGKVKKGVHKLTGKVVAVKKISKEHASIMVREIHHHKQLKHPNIIMLYEMVSTESSIHIISEYASNGDMLDALAESGGRCAENRVLKWFHQMTNAISYCHTRGIVHRDLKLENILLDKNDNVKICDFGFARFSRKNQLLETFCGSLCYSAPEIILQKKYTGPETDIWSLGVIIYTLLAGEYPFDDDSEVMTQRKIVQVDYQMPSYFSFELSSLIDSILQFEPSARSSIAKIKTHHWYCQAEEQGFKVTSPSNDSFHRSENIIQTESNTVAFKDDDPLTNNNSQNSARFSLPVFNHRSTMKTSLFRSSLPSKLPSNLTNIDRMVTPDSMSPCEKRLLNALDAAGFDKGTLIKMQTGECDTSRTLWHLLLENMKDDPRDTSSVDLTNSVVDNFAIALENKHKNENNITNDPQANSCICRNQASSNENHMHLSNSSNMTALNQLSKPYPIPVSPNSANIQITGFGSEEIPPEKNSWLSSIKSWFGASNNQQDKKSNRLDASLNSLEISTFRALNPSNYSELDLNTPDLPLMSPPVYRSGSQKYRRRKLQLSSPPIDEVDQLNYSRTTPFVNIAQRKKDYSGHIKSTKENKTEYNMPSPPPATAECFSSTRADSFSLLAYYQPMEVDVCEKRYSMYRYQQPTPPPSPPTNAPHNILIPTTPCVSEEKINECIEPDLTIPKNVSDLKSSPVEKTSNRFKINSPTRPRLALYGLQQQELIQSKIIIEEEEEEDIDEED
ncbi:Pkinase-domain-containing protein [Backusella circina FSU 941]|nr:Pkinase-domain-containing protein [Backusella circina FSU 941]